MFERFGDRARQVVVLAEEEALLLGHGHVGTEHLLLGILAEGSGPAARRLADAGATLAGCREMAAEAVGGGDGDGDRGEPALTERATRSLERASRAALRRHDAQVEPIHILASVLDVEGRAGQVLRGLAVDLPALRRSLDESSQPAAAPAAAAAPAGAPAAAAASAPGAEPGRPRHAEPVCANCGAELARCLAHKTIGSRGRGRFVVAYCAECGSAVGAAPAGA